MTVTEIVWFKATPALQADHTLVNTTIEKLRKVDGLLTSHFGFQVEDPTVAYILNVWESVDRQKSVSSHPSYGEIFGSLKPAMAGEVTMVVADLTSGPEPGINAPVVEIAIATPTSGHSTGELTNFLDSLARTEAMKGYHWGPVNGKDNEVVVFAGWESVEAHQSAVSGSFGQVAAKGQSLANLNAAHVKFSKI